MLGGSRQTGAVPPVLPPSQVDAYTTVLERYESAVLDPALGRPVGRQTRELYLMQASLGGAGSPRGWTGPLRPAQLHAHAWPARRTMRGSGRPDWLGFRCTTARVKDSPCEVPPRNSSSSGSTTRNSTSSP